MAMSEDFDRWCASVKDCGYEVQPGSATARQRSLGWNARQPEIDRLIAYREAEIEGLWRVIEGQRAQLKLANEMAQAGAAGVRRWGSPGWIRDPLHTAGYIHSLRLAIARYEPGQDVA